MPRTVLVYNAFLVGDCVLAGDAFWLAVLLHFAVITLIYANAALRPSYPLALAISLVTIVAHTLAMALPCRSPDGCGGGSSSSQSPHDHVANAVVTVSIGVGEARFSDPLSLAGAIARAAAALQEAGAAGRNPREAATPSGGDGALEDAA